MGMYYDAKILYGIKVANPDEIDWELWENMETAGTREGDIARKYGVHGVLAGHYDRDMMFLATSSESASLGTYKLITERNFNGNVVDKEKARVLAAAKKLGLPVQDGPGWFLVADLS